MLSWSTCLSDHEDQLIYSTDFTQLSNKMTISCLLVEQLTKRFTPVPIQPIPSHDRQHKPNETVDKYAEALNKLFVRHILIWLEEARKRRSWINCFYHISL